MNVLGVGGRGGGMSFRKTSREFGVISPFINISIKIILITQYM